MADVAGRRHYGGQPMRHREAGEYGDILVRYGDFLLYTGTRISEQLWQDASQHPALTRQDSRLQLASLAQQLKGAAAELRQVGDGLKEAKTFFQAVPRLYFAFKSCYPLRWTRFRPEDPLAADLAKLLLNSILGHRFEWTAEADINFMSYSINYGAMAVMPVKAAWSVSDKELTLGGGAAMSMSAHAQTGTSTSTVGIDSSQEEVPRKQE
jgi:hypothetical protein